MAIRPLCVQSGRVSRQRPNSLLVDASLRGGVGRSASPRGSSSMEMLRRAEYLAGGNIRRAGENF